MPPMKRLSHAIAEGDGISILVEVHDSDSAAIAERQGADGLVARESVPGVRQPVLFSRTELQYQRPPPRLGADTDGLLRERLELDDATLARLRRQRVIA